MGLVDALPVQRVRPALYLPLWLGSYRDASDNAIGMSAVNTPAWRPRDADVADLSGGYLVAASNAALTTNVITIFISGSFSDEDIDGTTRFVMKANNNYWFYTSISILRVFDGTTASIIARSTICCDTSLAVVHSGDAQKPEFFASGSSIGLGNNNITIPEANAAVNIGGSVQNPRSLYSCVLIYDAALTATEIAMLDTWSRGLTTPRKIWPGAGLDYTGATFTGEPQYIDNIQTARVSYTNETTGLLSNTGLTIASGTWKVSEDASGRYLDCVSAGQLKTRLVGASGMTTRLFTETGGATLTKTATEIQIDAGTGDEVRAIQLVAA